MTKRLKLDSTHDPTSSPDMPPANPPQFSTLPPEIRTIIYTHLFSLPNIQPTRLRTYRSSPPLTLHRPVFAAPTALFLTSRQIGSEARKVFYADNLLALVSIETTGLSAHLVWLLKTLPERITWALLPDDAPPPTGCPVCITYHRGRVDREDAASDSDEDGHDGGAGGHHMSLLPAESTPAAASQPLNINIHNKKKEKETKNRHLIIPTPHLHRLTREWSHAELTLPHCRFTIHSLPTSGWSLPRLTKLIWRPLTRLGGVKSVHPLRGTGDGNGGGGRVIRPVKILDRTGVFKGITFPKSERSKMREKLWKRWGRDPKERARRGAEQREELAMLRRPRDNVLTGWWQEDEVSRMEVGRVAERLVREMMSEGSEEDGKLDLGYFLEETAREREAVGGRGG